MPTMSLDFSKKPDLSSPAVEVRDLHAIARLSNEVKLIRLS